MTQIPKNEYYSDEKIQLARLKGELMAAPRSTYTALIVLGFLLILGAITYMLHEPNYNFKLIVAFVGVGLYIMIIGKWMFQKTGVVKVIKPYYHLGSGTVIVVLGFLMILATITLRLMNMPLEEKLMKIIPIIGVFFIVLGYMLAGAGKQRIRLEPE